MDVHVNNGYAHQSVPVSSSINVSRGGGSQRGGQGAQRGVEQLLGEVVLVEDVTREAAKGMAREAGEVEGEGNAAVMQRGLDIVLRLHLSQRPSSPR